jgi:hypothetical protein
VNAIEAELRDTAPSAVGLAQLIRRIQSLEKEKLLLTSAIFVEKMRVAEMNSRPEPDAGVLRLLETSVTSLTNKHTLVLEQINELLDEFRIDLYDHE